MKKIAKRFKKYEVQNNDDKESKNAKSKSKIILLILELIFIVMMLISGIKIILWYKENNKNNNILEKISNNVVIDETKANDDKDKYTVNFAELKNKNSEVVAWIKVNGTNIEYPVVKAKDNSYYLTHNIDKDYNTAGWIFADYKNKFDGTDKNIIVYGHNRKDKSMFGSLKNVLNKEWYENEENRKIIFFTEDEKSIYEVFSIYKVEDEEYYIRTNFNNNFEEFLNTIKKRSIYKSDLELKEDSEILTLSTCDGNNKYRLVVHAKKII